ncbi:MAG: Crp/Fnr family transcriptional regulator [Prevotella sp.]|nr:Crp/Fnr family transcriptional regulator [Prevotella sp.]
MNYYDLRIYDKLLQFPLFQGMSRADLTEVVAHTKLGFVKHPAGSTIVREGDPCTHLYILTDGKLKAETWADDHAYSVSEQLAAPYILQPERIFGITQRHTATFTTLSPTNLITIDKQEVLLLSETQLVFRLNLLNLMATETQRLAHQPWRSLPTTLRQRITRFLIAHTLRPAGQKTVRILMNRLAAELNDSRLNVSRELNAMQRDGLLTLSRGRIEIPMLERLVQTPTPSPPPSQGDREGSHVTSSPPSPPLRGGREGSHSPLGKLGWLLLPLWFLLASCGGQQQPKTFINQLTPSDSLSIELGQSELKHYRSPKLGFTVTYPTYLRHQLTDEEQMEVFLSDDVSLSYMIEDPMDENFRRSPGQMMMGMGADLVDVTDRASIHTGQDGELEYYGKVIDDSTRIITVILRYHPSHADAVEQLKQLVNDFEPHPTTPPNLPNGEE